MSWEFARKNERRTGKAAVISGNLSREDLSRGIGSAWIRKLRDVRWRVSETTMNNRQEPI